jgi:hypothetical protein
MQRPPELADVFGLLIGTGILMAIVMTLTLTVLAILRPPEKEDERDREVSLRATRNGYWAMATGMWAVAALIVAQPPPAVLVYALLGVFVLAELVRDVSQLVYYRLAV